MVLLALVCCCCGGGCCWLLIVRRSQRHAKRSLNAFASRGVATIADVERVFTESAVEPADAAAPDAASAAAAAAAAVADAAEAGRQSRLSRGRQQGFSAGRARVEMACSSWAKVQHHARARTAQRAEAEDRLWAAVERSLENSSPREERQSEAQRPSEAGATGSGRAVAQRWLADQLTHASQ